MQLVFIVLQVHTRTDIDEITVESVLDAQKVIGLEVKNVNRSETVPTCSVHATSSECRTESL